VGLEGEWNCLRIVSGGDLLLVMLSHRVELTEDTRVVVYRGPQFRCRSHELLPSCLALLNGYRLSFK
jgi:hypothetical protein